MGKLTYPTAINIRVLFLRFGYLNKSAVEGFGSSCCCYTEQKRMKETDDGLISQYMFLFCFCFN